MAVQNNNLSGNFDCRRGREREGKGKGEVREGYRLCRKLVERTLK